SLAVTEAQKLPALPSNLSCIAVAAFARLRRVTAEGDPTAAGPWLDHTPMDLNVLIDRKRERFEQLEREIADPALFSNRKRAGDLMREHASIKQLLAKWDELEAARKQLDDNRELATSRDVEIAAMADDEIQDLEKRVADL